MISVENVCEAWNEWKNAFLRISYIHATIQTSRMKNRYNPWINNEIVKLMYRNDYIHKVMVKNPSNEINNQYKSLRN